MRGLYFNFDTPVGTSLVSVWCLCCVPKYLWCETIGLITSAPLEATVSTSSTTLLINEYNWSHHTECHVGRLPTDLSGRIWTFSHKNRSPYPYPRLLGARETCPLTNALSKWKVSDEDLGVTLRETKVSCYWINNAGTVAAGARRPTALTTNPSRQYSHTIARLRTSSCRR